MPHRTAHYVRLRFVQKSCLTSDKFDSTINIKLNMNKLRSEITNLETDSKSYRTSCAGLVQYMKIIRRRLTLKWGVDCLHWYYTHTVLCISHFKRQKLYSWNVSIVFRLKSHLHSPYIGVYYILI